MKKGHYEKAFKSLRRLRNTDLQAARDLFFIHAQLKTELELKGDKSYFIRIMDLLTLPRNRSATIAAFTVMIAQQMCGSMSSLIDHITAIEANSCKSQHYRFLLIHGLQILWC